MWQKPIAITIDGITHSSVRKCCEYYGIKPNTVFNKMRRKKISATDAILDSIRPTYEVDGMKQNCRYGSILQYTTCHFRL